MEDFLVLVDEKDNQIGVEEKLRAHKEGRLHRAFSIFVFNSAGMLMLQKRADSKYHCPGLWTNTCCSHPRPGESIDQAGHRRLREEMGFDCAFEEAGTFIYKVKFDNGLTEHEYLHVLVGKFDGKPTVNPEEASDWKWISVPELTADMLKKGDTYTYWFTKALPVAIKHVIK